MMELLSNKSLLAKMASERGNKGTTSGNHNSGPNTTDQTYSDVLDSICTWGFGSNSMHNDAQNSSPPRNDYFFNNFLSSLDSQSDFSIGVALTNSNMRPPRISPESSNNSSISCSWCDVNASMRCVECNEFICNGCVREHRNSPHANHSIISLPTPIGTSPTGGMSTSVPSMHSPNYYCDQHNELLRYVCEYCKKLVCQCCTLHEHKDHCHISIQNFVDASREKIDVALESSRVGTKCIKSSIDKALAFIRHIERNCAELTDNIRKTFRQFIIAIEDRERYLLDYVEKLRQRRLAMLHDQMAGLKSALAGLAETTDMLNKLEENGGRMDHVDIAMKVTNGQRQLEQFAAIYKDLQPKQEIFAFAAPDHSLAQDIRNQGGIVLVDDKSMPLMNMSGGAIVSGAAAIGTESVGAVLSLAGNGIPNGVVPPNMRRPLLRDNSFRNASPIMPVRGGSACSIPNPGTEWELGMVRGSPSLHFGAPRTTQAIPGTTEPVRARKSNAITLSFATEGHDEGQVSRPWGLCVDKMGNILVSDRRNNRVQVFNPDGTIKFKFGRKGVGNGEFDLPAGICVDIDNRIIVVDKDNHRVQIFASNGVFKLKFGSYGKEYGQFQYPWDVAVNSRRQIVVTDSRNHRIQQFDSDGRFIRQIVFDNHGSNKGIASPRGVCYTPAGNIIVSDFDNHCLYLIDPDKNEILSVKGHEGSGYQEFNRPSGICCDDDGRIIVADSKNQRIVIYTPSLDFLWDIEIRPSINPLMPKTLDEKDRTCDVALMPDGRIAFLIELSPDSKEGSNHKKRFVHVF